MSDTRPGRAGHTPDFKTAVISAWTEGTLTTRELSEAFEISLRTVWRWTRDLPRRPRGRRAV